LPTLEEFAEVQRKNESEVLSEEEYTGIHSSSSPGENPYQ
jgi:hypothetical protein